MARHTKEEALETRERILDAAEKVFGQYGVDRTSLADVARAANVTRGAIYWHFQNKNDLFDAVCNRAALPMELLATAAVDDGEENPLGRLHAVCLSALQEAVVDPNGHRIFSAPSQKEEFVDPGGAILLRRRTSFGHSRTLFERILRHAVAKDQLPADLDTHLASKALHGILSGLLSEWMLAPGSFDLTSDMERLLDASIDAMRRIPALRRIE